jgi:hypothetical protein
MKNTFSAATILALILMSLASITALADDSKVAVVRAQGNAYHVNFVSAASKRGDLRLAIATKGTDTAFTEWLKATHPEAYRQAAARELVAGIKADSSFKAASSYCCVKDGRCCKTNCGQCCAKGTCTMGCCPMDACKKLNFVCCR